jgi:hypothetical protein
MRAIGFAGVAVIGGVLGLLLVAWAAAAVLVVAAAAGVHRVIEPVLHR